MSDVTGDNNPYPWKVDDDYPCKARTQGGEILHFDDLLFEGQRIGHSDGEDNVYPPFGVVVRREDGLWIVPEELAAASTEGGER